MWHVLHDTPFATGRTPMLDPQGLQHWVVVIKGTFSLFPDGSTQVADQQLEVLPAGEHHGKPGESSLRYENDLVLDKPRADVIVNASAYAPGGQPATEVTVGLKVADVIKKQLKVKGNRVYQRTVAGKVAPSSPLKFEKVPLLYERAYGGSDLRDKDVMKQKVFFPNPVGCGMALKADDLLDTPAPNVQFTDAAMRDDEAAGLGPIAGHWVPRSRYAGTFDQAWQENHHPLLPLDHDFRFNQCAPVDQQVDSALLPGARVVLTNLTQSGRLEFTVPRRSFRMRTTFGGYPRRKSVKHTPRLHTVVIEPDEQRLVLVWHSQLPLGRATDDIDQTIILEDTDA